MVWPRLRYALPVANLLVAAPLIISGYKHFHSPRTRFLPIELLVCHSINVPAVFFRLAVVRVADKIVPIVCTPRNLETCYYLTHLIDPAAFLFAVGMLWYAVGLELESIGQEKRAIVPSGTGARVSIDVLLILLGVSLALVTILNLIRPEAHDRAEIALQAFSGFAWSSVLLFAYASDLARCLRASFSLS